MKPEMKMESRQGRLLVVGAGPGPGYLTDRGRSLLLEGEVFVGGPSALAAAPAWGEKIPVTGPLDSVLDRVKQHRAQGRDVCVLTSGDPGFYSILSTLEEHFPGEALVEPGISSVQLLAARVGLGWQDMVHISVHGRNFERELEHGPGGAPAEVPLSILCDRDFGPAQVAEYLLAQGRTGRGVVGSRLGLEDEVVEVLPLEEIVSRSWPAPAALLALPPGWLKGRSGKMPSPQHPGKDLIQAEAFNRSDGLPLSRWEVRALLTAVARPRTHRVIWDVGAGSGGFSVELARANPQARVIAFERDAEACRCIGENARRFQVRVEVVPGPAPTAFRERDGEEGPDLVVVGGSGGHLREIIQEVGERMAPGGRVVITAVTLETVGVGQDRLSQSPWEGFQALQLSSARRERAGIMKGANPVTLLWADRKENS